MYAQGDIFAGKGMSTTVGHFVSSLREREIEEIVEEMKERDREERGTGMKGKKKTKGE